jgi:hypothetical protein
MVLSEPSSLESYANAQVLMEDPPEHHYKPDRRAVPTSVSADSSDIHLQDSLP